jgi:intein/homing endonuclease
LRKTSRCVVLNDKICDKKDEYITYTELFERPNTSAESNFKLKEIKIDSNFSKFLGLFLADGNCYKPDPTSYRVSISFNIKQTDLINEICDIVSNWGLNYSTSTRKNCLVLTFYNRFIYEILIKCYDEYKEKIFPHFLYNKFNSDNMGLILDYWIKGDGWLSKRKNIASHYIGCSTSMQLALTMRDIAISTGKHSTISLNKRNRYGKKCKDQYWVSIYNRNDISKSSLRKISDFEYSSVLDKKECYNYKGVTYNLEVQDDNSYVANGLVVHNCVMTLVNMTSIFRKNEFKEMVEEYGNKNKSFMDYINKLNK